jgi:ribosomal-protein-alanine N-acetyltransferase
MNLETERLRLRPVSADDLEHFVALYGDPDVMRFIGTRGALSREVTQERLAFMVNHWRQHGFGMWTLLRKADGAFVGRCGLRYLEESPEVELGYTLAKPFWGQGFATEASRAVVRYAFEVLKLDRLVAIADPANTASVNVMKKLGMAFEGMGQFYGTTCVLYALAPPGHPTTPPPRL